MNNKLTFTVCSFAAYSLTLRAVGPTMVEEGTNVTVEVVLDGALAPGITVSAVVAIIDGSALSKYQAVEHKRTLFFVERLLIY